MTLSERIKSAVLETVCRFAANLISSMHGFKEQAEPDAEAALRQALQKHIAKRDHEVQQMIQREVDLALQVELGNFAARLQDAICDGMNIECAPDTTMAELFAMIDTSIGRRVAISQSLHFQTFKVEEVQ